MKILGNNIMQTQQEILKNAHVQACNELKIPDFELNEAKDFHNVKHKVSEIMMDKLLGRPAPKRKSKISAHLGLNREESPFADSYPKWAVTDILKLKFLKSRLEHKEMPYQIYKDLITVLNVTDDDVSIEMGFEE